MNPQNHKKFKSITIRDFIPITNAQANFYLQVRLIEKEKLQTFANKITNVPEQVRIYTTNSLEIEN